MVQALEFEAPDIETASEAYARRFAGPAGQYLLAQQSAAVAKALEGWEGDSILDVGGAHAQLLPTFTARARRVVVFGSDALIFGRVISQFPTCRPVTGNLLQLPFPNESFDLVAAVRLVTHIESWQQLIAEMCRVARRTVLIDYPRAAGLNALTPLLFPLKKGMEGNTRTYLNFSDGQLDDAFQKYSFRATARHAQFLLPMVLHRGLKGAQILQQFERISAAARLTERWGSPVILRADRVGG